MSCVQTYRYTLPISFPVSSAQAFTTSRPFVRVTRGLFPLDCRHSAARTINDAVGSPWRRVFELFEIVHIVLVRTLTPVGVDCEVRVRIEICGEMLDFRLDVFANEEHTEEGMVQIALWTASGGAGGWTDAN